MLEHETTAPHGGPLPSNPAVPTRPPPNGGGRVVTACLPPPLACGSRLTGRIPPSRLIEDQPLQRLLLWTFFFARAPVL